MSTFGDNLKAARMAKKMTLVQCANALGITNPALSQWEQGKREPKYSMLIDLCLLFDTTPNDLLGFPPPNLRDSAPPCEAIKTGPIKTGNNSPVIFGDNIAPPKSTSTSRSTPRKERK